MRKIALAVSCCLLLPSLCWSQAPPKLSPEVRAFVKEDAPVVALTHVRVIDGTGAVPRTDQTLVIANGKITGMGDAACTNTCITPHRAVRRRCIPSTPQVFRDCIWRAV